MFKEVSEEDYVNEIIQGIKEDKVKTEKEQKRILKEKMKEMRNKLANNIDVLLNDKDLDLQEPNHADITQANYGHSYFEFKSQPNKKSKTKIEP